MKGGGGREAEGGCQSSLLAVALVCCQRHYPPTSTHAHLPTCPPATSHTSHGVTHFFLSSEHLGSAEPHTACSLPLRVWASVCVLQQTLRCPSSKSVRTVLALNSRPSPLHRRHILLDRLAKFSAHFTVPHNSRSKYRFFYFNFYEFYQSYPSCSPMREACD